jgi:hypothetical protein
MSTVHGEDSEDWRAIVVPDVGEVSSGGYGETSTTYPSSGVGAANPDAGEASSGSYGETSITYTSSGGYPIYQGASTQKPPYGSSTVPQATVASPQPTQTGMTNSAAQVFQAPPSTDRQTVLAYNILQYQPVSVFYSQAMQPWMTFISIFPKNMPMLWVNTQVGWQWYATCPLGGWAQMIMFVPQTGSLGLYEVYPDRTVKYYDYGYSTPGYHYIWFNGDTPGRHALFITVDRIPSNSVAFDVM